jgi:hypothetical protein
MSQIPTINVAPYRKAVAAVVGAVAVIGAAVGEAIADGQLDLADVIQIAAAVGTVLGVYQATNEPA